MSVKNYNFLLLGDLYQFLKILPQDSVWILRPILLIKENNIFIFLLTVEINVIIDCKH